MGDRFAIFEKQRKRAKQEETANKQQATEALNRRLAQQGLAGSGAAVKVQRQIDEESKKSLARRMEDIGGREQVEKGRLQDIKEARAFQIGEREAGQAFTTEQRKAAEKFASAERVGAQDFQAKQFDKQMGITQKQLDLANKEFEASKAANAINALISGANSKLSAAKMAAIMNMAGFPLDKEGSVMIGGTKIKAFDTPKEEAAKNKAFDKGVKKSMKKIKKADQDYDIGKIFKSVDRFERDRIKKAAKKISSWF